MIPAGPGEIEDSNDEDRLPPPLLDHDELYQSHDNSTHESDDDSSEVSNDELSFNSDDDNDNDNDNGPRWNSRRCEPISH